MFKIKHYWCTKCGRRYSEKLMKAKDFKCTRCDRRVKKEKEKK
ncbi:MAG: hypothetical protein ACOCRO_00750 [Halanaerobiales bacterium]